MKMKNLALFFCTLVIIQISGTFSKSSPYETIKFCSSPLDSYEVCIDSYIAKLGNYFLEDADAEDLPEIDPLKIKAITIYQKMNQGVEFRGLLEDIMVHGLQETDVERLRFDPETLDGYIHITIPAIHVKSKYSMVLKFANTNTTYNGMSNGNASDIDLQFYFQLDKIMKSDVEYFTINNMKGKIFVKKAQIMSKTLDPAQQSTADFFVGVFNKNYKRLLNEPNSMFQKHAIKMSRMIAEQLLSEIPAEKLLEQ